MDVIFHRFLENMLAEAKEVAQSSDVVRLRPMPADPPVTYLCEFRVPHLWRRPSGLVELSHQPVLGTIHFPEDYLRSTDSHLYMKVASVLTPNFVHPNVYGSVVCLGSAFAPGTRLSWLLREFYEIVSYSNYSLDERNSLNPEACRLLRAHGHLLESLKPEPFLRRKRNLQIAVRAV